MSKIKTPDWILGGKKKPTTKKSKGKRFKIRECPECGSDNVGIVLTEEEGKPTREWECSDCKWKGADIKEKELNEEEFIKYTDKEEKEEESDT